MKKRSFKTDNWEKKDFEKIKDEINSIIAMVARVDRRKIEKEVNLKDDLGIDSLKAMEILAAVETKFGITISSTEVFDVVTLKDMYKLIKSYLR